MLREISVDGVLQQNRGHSGRQYYAPGGLLLAEAVEKLASWELPAIA
jgi:hypothetical protein